MRLLIAGGGLAGLTFLHALRHFHPAFDAPTLTLDLVERAPAFRDGVGIVLHPNALQVLETVGLTQAILPFTQTIDTLHINKKDGESVIDLPRVWDGRTTRTILRKGLHDLLAANTTGRLPVRIRMGCALTHLVQQGPEVIAGFDNGERDVYDLVIGADGVHSRVRSLLFPHVTPVSTQLFYTRFIARNELGLAPHTWTTFEREEGSYGFIPLAGNRLHCFVQIPVPEHPCLHGQEEAYLRHAVVPWAPEIARALRARCSPLQSGLAYMVPPGHWHQGTCVLMGDAAHALSPTLSEGGALAMEDALVLALSLLGAHSTEQALTAYRQAREQRCLWAYRMALTQLNSIRVKRKPSLSAGADRTAATRLMAAMYRPFLDDPLRLQPWRTHAAALIDPLIHSSTK